MDSEGKPRRFLQISCNLIGIIIETGSVTEGLLRQFDTERVHAPYLSDIGREEIVDVTASVGSPIDSRYGPLIRPIAGPVPIVPVGANIN